MSEKYDPRFWQDGLHGNANVVTFDGEDVRPVMRISDDGIRARVILEQNRTMREAITRPAPSEEEVEAAAKRMGEVEVLATSGCETLLVKEYLTADELLRMARAALGVKGG